MKLNCHRPTLLAALQVVSGVIHTRTTKDILKNVKLQVADGKAVLIGTDSEVGMRYNLGGIEAESAGDVLLPTNRVIAILREVQEESVQLELDSDALWVRSAHSEFQLSSIDVAEFPDVPAFDDEEYQVVAARALKEMIRRTAFATDSESTRYALGGILLEMNEESIVLAATDSRRLAVTSSSARRVGEGPRPEQMPVVPAKAMQLAERSLGDDEEEVFIAVHPNDVLLQTDQFTIYSRLVEGRFPRYKDVVPKDSAITLEVVVGPLYSAVRQAQIVTSDESRGVEFKFADGMLTLNSQSADVGQSKVELPISYDHEELKIIFDPRYIAEFLRVLEPESQVSLSLSSSESAAVFRTSDDAYTYVIMPLSSKEQR